MIEENEIELVGIATESGLHAEVALYCIDAWNQLYYRETDGNEH